RSELIDGGAGLSTGKDAVPLLSALNRRILIDAQDCLDRRRLTDNSHVGGLEHHNQCERPAAVALSLPKRDCNPTIRSLGTAFGDPFVRSECLLAGCRRGGEKSDAQTKDRQHRSAKITYLHSTCLADTAQSFDREKITNPAQRGKSAKVVPFPR